MSEDVSVVREAYEAWNLAGPGALRDRVVEDVELHDPPQMPDGRVWRGWDEVGKALYMADYLEPGRTHEPDLAALASRVPQAFDAVLREVAARRMGWLLKSGKPIARQTWDFWNGLVAGDSSSW